MLNASILSLVTQSPPDKRDYQFNVSAITPDQYPSRYDLRVYGAEIEDQLSIGSCTCNSSTSLVELKELRRKNKIDLSRLFPYYEVRSMESRLDQEGAVLRDVMKVLLNVGVPNEPIWPYDITQENVKPSLMAYGEAAGQKILQYEAVPMNKDGTVSGMQETVNNFKSALLQDQPIVVALTVYNWIFGLKGDMHTHSIIDTTIPNYRDVAGGHAIVIVGYDDNLNGGSFIIQNSWGKAWGDNGYGALAYSVVADIFEAWVTHGFITSDTSPLVAPVLPYTTNQIMVAALYAALFGNVPDSGGFAYWLGQIASTGAETVAYAMYHVDPARPFYPYFYTNQQIVTKFYLNVLGRQIDMASLGYWSGRLDNESVGTMIVSMINAVRGYTGNDAAGMVSKKLLNNKIDVSLYVCMTLNCSDPTILAGALTGVTSEYETVVAAKARVKTLMGV